MASGNDKTPVATETSHIARNYRLGSGSKEIMENIALLTRKDRKYPVTVLFYFNSPQPTREALFKGYRLLLQYIIHP